MIDLHTHTTFSDGVLIPSELARRVQVLGLSAVALTDHGDFSNLSLIVPRIRETALRWNRLSGIRVLAGIELTHIPPELMGEAVEQARSLDAFPVVVHGETVAEPVAPGTNRAAIEAGVDILAHPGLLSEGDAALAAENGVLLEITGRKGHSLTNGLVAKIALAAGAGLVVNSDGHAPGDFMDEKRARIVALGAGLSQGQWEAALAASRNLVRRGLALSDLS